MQEPSDSSSDTLDLHEMMRIMDVASTLRKERETVLRELNLEQTKQHLRERLQAAAEVTGDQVTPAEIEAAIDQYYANLHAFVEPRRSLRTVLAHLYIRRRAIAAVFIPLVLMGVLVWALFLARFAPLSGEARQQRRIATVQASIERQHNEIQAIVRDADSKSEAESLLAESEVYKNDGNAQALNSVADELDRLLVDLQAEYTIRVVSEPGELSGIPREVENTGAVSGYYLILEARDPSGNVVSQRIRNRETGEFESVDRWGEQVPLEVFERIEKDKREDGVVDRNVFAVKEKGYRAEVVKMLDAGGQPLVRQGQITSWKP